MGAVKDVLVATGACHRCDFAAVKADADVADELRRRGRGGVRHRAAEMEPLKRQEKEKQLSSTFMVTPTSLRSYCKNDYTKRYANVWKSTASQIVGNWRTYFRWPLLNSEECTYYVIRGFFHNLRKTGGT